MLDLVATLLAEVEKLCSADTQFLNLCGSAACCAGLSQLGNHAEVVMLDFAATLLAELEKWMSSASTAMVDLSSYADSDRFIGPASMVVDIQRRLYTDEVVPGC